MKRTVRIALGSGLAAALLAGAGACSSSSPKSSGSGNPPTPSTPAPAAAGTITITNFTFTGPLTVPAGATVSATDSDSVDHTVTSDGVGQFDVRVPAGQTVTFTAPAAAGTYPYHCSIHPFMHGTLIVK